MKLRSILSICSESIIGWQTSYGKNWEWVSGKPKPPLIMIEYTKWQKLSNTTSWTVHFWNADGSDYGGLVGVTPIVPHYRHILRVC